MTILKTSKDLTTQDKYFLTMSPEVQKMADQKSQIIEISKWCIYSDLNKDDKEQIILAIATPENEIFATNSTTFRADFERMIDIFDNDGEEVHSIKVISGFSKANREFITCVYVA
jgi:hypothetical protein